VPAAYGRIRVLHQIGTGSLGPVFRGDDPQRRDPVAIKVLHLPLTQDARVQVVERLQAVAADTPNHVAIARVLDAGVAGERCYIESTLVTGEPLDVALATYGPATIADAVPRLRNLAEALDLAADNGVWHGALHPPDILVSADETVVVGLGVASTLEAVGVAVARRDPYTAPEVVSGKSTSRAADQFALAAIAYEWLFGRKITGPADEPLVIPSLPAVAPERLTAAFQRALSRTPAQRYRSHREFVDAVAASMMEEIAAPVPDPRVLALTARRSQETLIAPPAALLPQADTGPIRQAALSGIEPGEQLIEVFPAEAPADIADLTIDPEPPVTPTIVSSVTAAEREPVAEIKSEPEERKAYGPATLVAVLLIGIAIGGAGGFFAGSRGIERGDPAMVASATEVPTFTEAPIDNAAPSGDRLPPAAASRPTAPAPSESPVVRNQAPAAAPQAAPASTPGVSAVLPKPTPPPRPPSSLATTARTSGSRQAAPPAAAVAGLTPRAAGPSGTLVVQSRPAGAQVSINGRTSGVTPLTLATLPPGAHRVRLERPGYEPWITTVRVPAGGRARVGASLTGENERE
jgi:hypothetical protein